MRGRYQIVISARSGSSSDQREGIWARFKALVVGLGFLIVAAGVFIAALIFGSILAAVLWVCLVVVIAVVILKNAWRKVN